MGPVLHILLLLLSFPSFSEPKSPSLTPDTTDPLPPKAKPTKTGYLSVNRTTGSAIFYAYYEAHNSSYPLSQTPILIWLQGGPGCSSLLGNFFELGPWRVSPSQRHTLKQVALQPNPGSWNRIFGLVFLDNPIGVGFSIAATPEEIPRDQKSVARHLFRAITQFVALDPSFKSRPLYFTGESYAGKYVPAIGYYTLKWNAQLLPWQRLNLAGVAIGNGLTDPATQVATHADNAYYLGLINEKQKSEIEMAQLEAVKLTKAGHWSEATNARSRVLSLLQNMTGLATLNDYRRLIPYQSGLVMEFLKNPKAKAALGVNVSMEWEECSDAVGAALYEDVMKDVKCMVGVLVKKSKVLLYQGQCDLRDGIVATEAWVKQMQWEEIDRFMEAERRVWEVKGKLAGYVQKWDSLTNVVVLGAGHLVPADQAVNSQKMIEDWVLERGLFGSEHNSAVVFQHKQKMHELILSNINHIHTRNEEPQLKG